MDINVKKKYPKYLKEFKCIGGKCTDSCCIGWDIDIDKTTFRQYYKVKDVEMKKMFQKNLYNNEYCTSDNIDYGRVKLKGEKRCPFLDDEKYCIIYSRLGEEYLSNVCTCFPRILNKIDGFYEMSLDISCPEAARILLSKKEGIEFTKSNETLGKHIISSEINTKSKEFDGSLIKYFTEIRDLSIKIIQNRNLSLDKRLYILGEFLNEVEDEFECNYSNLSNFINKYDINLVKNIYEKDEIRYTLQAAFFKTVFKLANVFEKTDSDVFKKYTKEVMEIFKLDEENIVSNSELYIGAFKTYNNKFMEEYSYIFENYLVNFIYNNIFPFSESQSVFDGYILLLIRYAYIKFYLVGLYLNNEKESEENIINFIQIFSKSIEHHKTLLFDLLNYIKRNDYNNIEFAKMFLPEITF